MDSVGLFVIEWNLEMSCSNELSGACTVRRVLTVRRPIRLLAIDLDGTLLDDDKRIGPRTCAALREVIAGGICVVIASARPPRSVRPIYRQLQLDAWQINYNGALIWDESIGHALRHRPLSGPLTQRVIQVARRACPEVAVSCEILDRWYTDRCDPRFLTETARLVGPDVIAPLHTFWSQAVTKVLLQGHSEAMMALEAVLRETFLIQISVVRSDQGTLLQINDRRASKSGALRWVAKRYGIPLREVMAVGDGLNDLDMLVASGVAVAVANAAPALKAVADWIAPSNNAEAVYAALQHFDLCKPQP